MEFLQIPDLFKGEWENLLIMTYGAEIPFFENSLWRQFSNRCRNKIVLADTKQYLTAYDAYRAGKLVDYDYPEEEIAKIQARLPEVPVEV